MTRYLKEILSVIQGDYVIGFADRKFRDMDELEKYLRTEKIDIGYAGLVVESISASEGKIQINAIKNPVIPNDMNAPWVKEHIAMYGKEPNPFDGC